LGSSGFWVRSATTLTAVALLCLGACAPFGLGPREVIPELAHPPLFPAFTRHPSDAPAISSGRAGWPITVFDPAVYVDDEGYHLFYTTVFCRRLYSYAYTWNPADQEECDIVQDVGTVGYAFSSDRGRSWEFRQTPVVRPSHAGFDSAKIETPHVFRVGKTLYLAYSADGDLKGKKLESRYQIGVARLELGRQSVREALLEEERHFQRRSKPLLAYDSRLGRFDNNVQEPSVIVHEDHIELYYVGIGVKLPEESIGAPGQAVTSVGLGRAELDLELNVLSRSAARLQDGANITEVKYFGGSYHLFASSLVLGEFHQGEAITHSISADGRNWSPPLVILSPNEAPGFDNWGLMAPTVAVEKDRVFLFYTAYEAAPHKCFPVPAEGRFGMPVAQDSKCLFAALGRAVSARVDSR
jgi:hypothetical protein